MNVLAIDHGERSGFAVFEDKEYYTSGFIELASIKNLDDAYNNYERLFTMFSPTVVVVEKINVAGAKFGGDNVIKLAQLQAMIRLLCLRYNTVIFEVNPKSMKKHITGNGNALKVEVAKVLAERWNLILDEICTPVYYKRKEGIKEYKADQSDAIGLGTYYIDVAK